MYAYRRVACQKIKKRYMIEIWPIQIGFRKFISNSFQAVYFQIFMILHEFKFKIKHIFFEFLMLSTLLNYENTYLNILFEKIDEKPKYGYFEHCS